MATLDNPKGAALVNPASERITLRFLAGPGDVSAAGTTVPAGHILEWIDKAGYACAVGWSSSYCVTAYVGNVHFTRTVEPGEMIEVRARLVFTGRTSMHVLVTVDGADARERNFTQAMHCLLVFVALDDDGTPQPVPEWKPSSDGDLTLQQLAEARIEPRRQIQLAMQEQRYSEAGTAPRTVFRFLAAPADANWSGNAHGRRIMRWIDEAAYACAAAWSSEAAAAVYSGGIQFHHPIHIGDIVEVEARLIFTSAHSMHISVHVRSGSPRRPDNLHLATQCLTIFVDPRADGRPRLITPLPMKSGEDQLLYNHARELIALRARMAAFPAGFSPEAY